MDLSQRIVKNWTDEAYDYGINVRDELESDTPKQWIKIIHQYVPGDQTLDFLDVGTGPGFFPIILSKVGHRVTGIDCTKAMIEQAKANAGLYDTSPDFILAESDDLPFDDERFDCVISRNVAWTLIRPVESYVEWLRVLKPGGKLLIFDANWNHRYHNTDLMKQHLEDMKKYSTLYKEESLYHSLDDEGESFRKSVPMSRVMRPGWDLQFFSGLDVSRITCDLKVYESVWNEKRKTAFASTPMFLIVVEK